MLRRCSLLFLGLGIALSPAMLSAQEKASVDAKVEKGKPAPDFEVQGIEGKFKLSDRTKRDKHIVLMFSRAGW